MPLSKGMANVYGQFQVPQYKHWAIASNVSILKKLNPKSECLYETFDKQF